MTTLDPSNDQLVGVNGYGQVSIAFPKNPMTRAEGLRLAAWLVVVCDPVGEEFEAVLKAVRST